MGANAQTSVPTFTASQVLTAAQMNESARTGVPVFASTVTRDAAFDGSGEKTLAEGQLCYIEAAPKRLQIYNGTAWLDFDAEGTTFTPTFTGYTRGNGTSSAIYYRVGKQVFVYVREVLGTTSSVTAAIVLTLPINSTQYRVGGSGQIQDSGTANFATALGVDVANKAELIALNSAGTYAQMVNATATVPMTWTTNDFFIMQIVYEAA